MKTEIDIISQALEKAARERHPCWPKPDFDFYARYVKKGLDEYRCSGQMKAAAQLAYDWYRGRTVASVRDVCRELRRALGINEEEENEDI